MKIIDQYLCAIGQKLPLKGREDIKKELKSLLLDEIEENYGTNPTEVELFSAITAFGSPGTVARRYTDTKLVIGSGLTEIYFMIIKLITFALTIAFSTLFIVSLFTNNFSDATMVQSLGKIPLYIFNGSISGIGIVTLIFIIITRFSKDKEIDLEEDWTPAELKGISIDTNMKSELESVFSISFMAIIIVILNFFPHLITSAEQLFEKTGFSLGNRMDLATFKPYALFLTLLCIGEITNSTLQFGTGSKSKWLSLFTPVLSIGTIFLFSLMVLDSNLFILSTALKSPVYSLIGFKALFLLILIITSLEFIATSAKSLYRSVVRKYSGNG